MLQEKLRDIISGYPNFPKEGILFRDLTPLFRDPILFGELIEEMLEIPIVKKSECLIGVDARGFLFASCISNLMKKPLVLARKKGKLPGVLIEKSYELEYGKNVLTIQKDSIAKYDQFVVIDDLLATGGTIKCIAEILASENKILNGACVVVELLDLKARDIFDFPIYSQVQY
tara:strand:- start:445 stop:963 length:519 start_codon:yes stop_codon:yes gene_type:complete